jgi:hypothetical protein
MIANAPDAGGGQRVRMHVIIARNDEPAGRIDRLDLAVCRRVRGLRHADDLPVIHQDAHRRRQCAGGGIDHRHTVEPQLARDRQRRRLARGLAFAGQEIPSNQNDRDA